MDIPLNISIPFVTGFNNSQTVLAAILLVTVLAVGVALLKHHRQRVTVDIDREFTVASTEESNSIQVRTRLRNEGESAVRPENVLSSVPPWLQSMTEPGRIDAPLEPGEELRLTFVTAFDIGDSTEVIEHAGVTQSALVHEAAVTPDETA